MWPFKFNNNLSWCKAKSSGAGIVFNYLTIWENVFILFVLLLNKIRCNYIPTYICIVSLIDFNLLRVGRDACEVVVRRRAVVVVVEAARQRRLSPRLAKYKTVSRAACGRKHVSLAAQTLSPTVCFYFVCTLAQPEKLKAQSSEEFEVSAC